MDETLKAIVERTLGNADPSLARASPEFMTQAVLLTSRALGAAEGAIADALEYELEFVQTIGSRLRNAGIWRGSALDAEHANAWDDDAKGGVAFLMDAHVAGGTFELVSRDDTGEPRYALSDAGRRSAERIIRNL